MNDNPPLAPPLPADDRRSPPAVAWAGHQAGSRAYRRILLALWCGGIATFTQLYAPQGVLPRIAEEQHVSAAQASLLVSAATVGLMFGVVPWGWLADRMGRVRAMKASLLVATACGFAVAACPSFEGALVLRAMQGFALGGLPAVAIAYLNEEIHRSEVAVAAALYISGTSIGGLLGRIVSAPVAQAYGWRTGIFCVTLIGALSTVAFFVATPTALGFDRKARRVSLLRAIVLNVRRRDLVVLFVEGMLLMGAHVALFNYLAFHLESAPFFLEPATVTFFFFVYLAGTFSSGWAGRLVRPFGRIRVLCGSIALMVTGAAAMLAPSLVVFTAGLLLFATGFFAAHAIVSGWVGFRAREGRTQATSLYTLSYYLGSSFFGWFCGVVFDHAGWTALIAMVAGLAMSAACVAVLDWRANPREA